MTHDQKEIEAMLKSRKHLHRLVKSCLACGACRDSCFVYCNSGDIKKSPAAKIDASLGLLFRKKGSLTKDQVKEVERIVFHDCLLCRRCYCPMGIDIPGMIAFTRSICRSQGLDGRKDIESYKEDKENSEGGS